MGEIKKMRRIEERHWAPGDDYLVLPDTQVFEEDGFKKGTPVKVTIEIITEQEYQKWLRLGGETKRKPGNG